MSGKLYLIVVLAIVGCTQAMDLKRLLDGQAKRMRNRRALPNPIQNWGDDDLREAQRETSTITCRGNEGQRWYHGCDTCTCEAQPEVGFARTETRPVARVRCSRRSCSRPFQKRDVSAVLEERAQMCNGGHLPGETYDKDCNRCHCSHGGMEFCTMKNCRLSPSDSDEADDVVDTNANEITNELCRNQGLAGHKFTDGCHICYCSRHGLMCSTNYCPILPASYWVRKFRSDRQRQRQLVEHRRSGFDF